MRVEATIADARAAALAELAKELRLSRSQILDEALALFLSAVLEVRRGRRLATIGSAGSPREIVTPTLALIEWTTHRQGLRLPEDAVRKMAALAKHPPNANKALRRLMKPEAR